MSIGRSRPRGVVAVAGGQGALGGHVGRALAMAGYQVRPVPGAFRGRTAPSLASLGPPAPAGPRAGGRTALVLVSELALPAGAFRLAQLRYRRDRLRLRSVDLACLAWARGAKSLVTLSSALLYGPAAGGGPWPVDPPPEAAEAEAAEAAAEAFSGLGGHSVVLRLGWPYGPGDPLTRQVLRGASNGWQLLDGPAGTYVPTIEISDAAAAAVAALDMPPGTYDVTDRFPRTQWELSDALAAGFGRPLFPLSDWRWGHGPLLGPSRRVRGTAFAAAADWNPAFPDAAVRFRGLSRAPVPGGTAHEWLSATAPGRAAGSQPAGSRRRRPEPA